MSPSPDLTSPRAEPLDGLGTALFVHTVDAPDGRHPHGGVGAVRDLLTRHGVGVVYVLPRKGRLRAATAAVHQTRLRAPRAPILLDASHYSGKARKLGEAGIDPAWIRRQHHDGVRFALTDSGYIPAHDHTSLHKILRTAAGIHDKLNRGRGVIAALPVAVEWLTKDADDLHDAIATYGVPTALMIEHEKDPLALKGAPTGLAHVLQAPVTTGILRCDVSVLGALAYGAALVAVGDSSALRHFFPRKTGGGGYIPGTSVLVPKLLGFYRIDKLDEAIAATPDDKVWRCDCRVCHGRSLAWITASKQPNADALAHSVSAISAMANDLFVNRGDSFARHAAWHDAVQEAETAHLDAALGKPPVALRRWQELHATRQPAIA
jgi:hypothetical protein